jgi:hypothetical protein
VELVVVVAHQSWSFQVVRQEQMWRAGTSGSSEIQELVVPSGSSGSSGSSGNSSKSGHQEFRS